MRPIVTTSNLAQACARLRRHDFVAVDTEFIREHTFWPRLCLIQMAGPEEELIVIKEGTVLSLVGGKEYRLGPGSVILQASNELHGLRNVGDTPATYHVILWRSAATPPKASSGE